MKLGDTVRLLRLAQSACIFPLVATLLVVCRHCSPRGGFVFLACAAQVILGEEMQPPSLKHMTIAA